MEPVLANGSPASWVSSWLARFLQILMVVAASHHFARRFTKTLPSHGGDGWTTVV